MVGSGPLDEELVPLAYRQQWQTRERSFRVRGDRFEQRSIVTGQAGDRVRVEEIGVVLERSDETIGGFRHRRREVEDGRSALDLKAGALARRRDRRLVEKLERHLEERVARGIPFWLELLDQHLEGEVLMRVRPEGRLPHAA